VLVAAALFAACGEGAGDDGGKAETYSQSWFMEQTIAERGTLSVPYAHQLLTAEKLAPQLEAYDPGSTVRCRVHDDPAYAAVMNQVGGVEWGYDVRILPDTSKPLFKKGFDAAEGWGTGGSSSAGGVEIAEADIVGTSDTSALFISKQHGLLLADLSGDRATFRCAAKLPGAVDQFYLHNGRLVVIVQDATRSTGHLLHFSVANDELAFVEAVHLGASRVLDSRRFNDRLVIYTDLRLDGDPTPTCGLYAYWCDVSDKKQHRVLRVYNWGDRLVEELTETHIDDLPIEHYLTRAELDRNSPVGTVLAQSSRMSQSMWASDRYFVVTEEQTDTILTGWSTQHYSVCIESHYVPYTYESCTTQYETKPNPAYVPPDNSGGDRACSGTTLASCIRKAAAEAAETIRFPVGTTCELVEAQRYVCDKAESKSYTYPTSSGRTSSRLHIYEYTEAGFIRFADEVTDIDAANLTSTDLDAPVETLTLSDEAADLTVNGRVQSVQFQNDYLYVISEGRLQTYALAPNSLLRTSELTVAGGSIQTTRFTNDKLYLSDGQWQSSGETSVLRVVDLTNPAFPAQASQDRHLPGNHELILPTTSGILTAGYVSRFEGQNVNLIKLGLFSDPETVELSYLFLGTDLEYPRSAPTAASHFDGQVERLFWPYSGTDTTERVSRARVGISHIESTDIVSEGAVDVPELPLRVRPRPGTAELLTFANSSMNGLSKRGDGWVASPVFEYFTPVALYRLNDADDYVEVLNLGNRCRLHFAQASALNERPTSAITEPFLCGGAYVVAHQQNLLWNDKLGVSFHLDGTVEPLSEEAAKDLWTKAHARDVCLFSEDVAQRYINTIDPRDPPPLDTLVCMSREEHQKREKEAQR
jgi:hypothetical protein